MNAKLQKAITKLVLQFPFFGYTLMQMERQDVALEGEVRIATDGRTLYFDPSKIEHDGASHPDIMADLAQCALRVMLLHHVRRGMRDAATWDLAGKLAVNGELKESGLRLPEHYAYDESFYGMGAEKIYDAIKRPEPPPKPEPTDDEEEDENQGADAGSQDKPDAPDESAGSGTDQGDDEGDTQKGQTSMNFNGEDATGDQGEDSQPDAPAIDHSVLSETATVIDCQQVEEDTGTAEEAKEEQRINVMIQQAAQYAKQAGKLPGIGERLLALLQRGRTPWRELLWDYLTATDRSDYSWRRPNSAIYSTYGLYVPSMQSEGVDTMVIIFDTSASITDETAEEFVSELNAIREEINPQKTYVFFVDTRVQSVLEFEQYEHVEVVVPQGGGTRFTPAFEYMDREGIVPDVAVYLTDLYCNDYPTEPVFPVVWATPTQHYKAPPFGPVIYLPN